MYINNNCHITLWLTMMEGQQSLTLCWRSFWRWGRKRFTFIFAYKVSQWSVYDYAQPVAPQNTHDTWPTIVDTLLTHIFMMGQGGYRTLFCLERKPKFPLWLTTTYWRCDFPGRMTKNHWLSIATHFHDGAGRVLQSVFPIKAGKNFFISCYNLSELWFPRRHDQKLLVLRWCTFSWRGREGIATCFAYKGWQKLLYDWVQPIRGVISQDARTKIVDSPLTLIFIIGQGGYCILFCLKRKPKIPLWQTTT
jgi:hypothetical protein